MDSRMNLNQPVMRTTDSSERIATHLPAWDLLPPQALLVRRRGGHHAEPMAVPTNDASAPVHRSSVEVTEPAAAPSLPSAPHPQAPAVCRQCQEPLDDGASFCSECGTRQ